MHRTVVLALYLASISVNYVLGQVTTTAGQNRELAVEGRGLLPVPVIEPGILSTTPLANSFKFDSSGELSRMVYQTNEDPHFNVVVRDFSIPPDGKNHRLTFTVTSMLQIHGDLAKISVDSQEIALPDTQNIAVTPGATVDVVNSGKREAVISVIAVERMQR